MVKTILVPVDFTVQSLNTLKLALSLNENNEVFVLLLHAQLLPDSIPELLFYSPRREVKELLNPNFEKALDVLKNKYESQFRDSRIELLHSNCSALLRNIIEANHVSEVYLPKNYSFREAKRSFDPLPLLRNSGFPVYEVEWKSASVSNGSDELDALFN